MYSRGGNLKAYPSLSLTYAKIFMFQNLRLQRKLQLEVERREALCRHLSESESSLEMEEERFYNENVMGQRQRTISSPVPHSPSSSRPLSPGGGMGSGTHSNRCFSCGQIVVS